MGRGIGTVRRHHVTGLVHDENALQLRQVGGHARQYVVQRCLAREQSLGVVIAEDVEHTVEQRDVRFDDLQRMLFGSARGAIDTQARVRDSLLVQVERRADKHDNRDQCG